MDPSQLQPGHRLDRYELLCPLAYGGMASVWLARFGGRRGFERLVVVKMILPQFASDPRFQEMFVDEARIASKIEHVNVARILDVGEHDENTTYIVMEWIDGDSLSKVMRAVEHKRARVALVPGEDARVPAGIALRVCADAAAGLHAAHVLKGRDGVSLGVVHRDVSPQNILISNAGTTVIIDFGVAKARDRVSQDTSAGQLKGKIRYMAPEQALGKDIDHRADVWAVGAILYELFAGESPYDGPNEVATLHNLTRGVAPKPLPDDVPESVRVVIMRALSYDANDRYATALELNLALESAMVEIEQPTSAAAVARYTEVLLAERKLARRRGVDEALALAHARDAERLSQSSPSAPQSGPPQAASEPPFAPQETERSSLTPSAPSGHMGSLAPSSRGLAAAPVLSSRPHAMMLGYSESTEAPSAASSATLGSAAIEYGPEAFGQGARRRRLLTAVVLAVSIVAGAIGIALIISAAVLHRENKSMSASSAAPAEAIDTPPAATALATTPAEPTPPMVAVATASAASSAPVTVTRRPPTSVGMPSRAKPAAVPTTPGKPDRGF